MTDFFSCLLCGSDACNCGSEAWVCERCGACYPLQQGVPLLVRDPSGFEQRLAGARAANPLWYVEKHEDGSASPFRHHLAKRRTYVRQALQAHLKPAGEPRVPRLLDLGCGDGHNLSFLQPFARHVYASDYNVVRLARARGAAADSTTLFLADILDYPAKSDFFDIVFFNHVIEHIPEDEHALASVARILKPGGLLVLGTPNEGAWWWQLAYKLQPEFLRMTDHVHFYTSESMAAIVRRAGLRVVETKLLGWGPPHWSLDGRLRAHKPLDDAFEILGRALIPSQASSMYLLATKG